MDIKKWVSALMAACVFTSTAVPAVGAARQRDVQYEIIGLKVNGFTDPIGIDTKKPVFSFEIKTQEYNKSLSAYRILVLNDEKQVWDSGKVSSKNPYDIVYGGEQLGSLKDYKWNVQAWDESGKNLGTSEYAEFSTGFLNAGDWSGSFITASASGEDCSFDGAKWIWRRNGAAFSAVPAQTMYFRKNVEIKSNLKSAVLIFTADDVSQGYVNGKSAGTTGEWASARRTDVTSMLNEGKNVLAFKAENTSSGYAGMLAKLYITYAGGDKETIVSNAEFLTSDALSEGWNTAGFDDSNWKAPDQAEAYGSAPWNNGVNIGASPSNAAPIFRKKFTVTKQVKSATAYVCAGGLSDLEVNGEKADESVLNPANTDYNKSILYTAHDITRLVLQGENAVGVMLGNGFYNSIMPGWNWSSASWRTAPKLLMNIVIKYTDSTSDTIATGADFSASLDGPVTENDIYYGETYDARKEMPGYSEAAFDDGGWSSAVVTTAPKGEIKHQSMEPVTKSTPHDVEVTKNGKGSYIVKNSVVTAGWLGINFNQPKGCELTITYGEKLNASGELVTKEEGGRATQRDKYICKGSNDYYEPRFSYKGFQYVQIDGAQNEIKSEEIKSYDVHNAVETRGSFDSSNELINTLHEIEVRTMLNNFHGKATDTPYLEKNGWLGDANIALEMFGYNFSVEGLLKKMIGDMQDAQEESGSIPSLVPIYNWGTSNVPVWNSIFIFAVENMDNIYGTDSYIAQQYDAMRKLALLDVNTCKGNGWLWNDNGATSDWVSPMGGEDLPYIESDPEGAVIYQTAYVYKLLKTMEELSANLGKSADSSEYKTAADKILKAYNDKFYIKDKGIYDSGTWNSGAASARTKYRQSANILPLAFDMVAKENRQNVIDNLIKDIKSKNYHLDTGMIGTKYILPVLCEIGYSDVAYRILTQETYPSWGFWAVNGATTAHEMWETTSRSLDHYFLGTYDEWLYKGIGGIDEIKDGYASFTYRPQLSNDLSNADVVIKTVRGELKSGFVRGVNGKVTLKLTVPFGSSATAVVPDSSAKNVTVNSQPVSTDIAGVNKISENENGVELTLGSGSYEIECSADRAKLYDLALKEAVAEAEKLSEFDYTAAAWSEFSAELDRAKMVLESAKNQSELIDSADKLAKKVAELSENLNEARAGLRTLLNVISESGTTKYNVIKSSWDALSKEIAVAEEILGKQAEDEQVNAAYLELLEKYNGALKARVGNLAKNKPVTVSSDVGNGDWNASKLTDSNRTNLNSDGEYCGWSSSSNLGESHEEWAIIDLKSELCFDNVIIYPSTSNPDEDKSCYGMPEDYNISVSSDRANWKTVYQKSGQPLAGYAAIKVGVGEQKARYVKISGTKLRPKKSDGDSYRMQLAELEVYNSVENGFIELNGETYYYKNNEPCVKTFIVADGKRYYFNYNGVMQRSKWVTDPDNPNDKYYLTEDGSAATGNFVSINGDEYCFAGDGKLLKLQWLNSSGRKYYLDAAGKILKNTWSDIGGNDYYFGKSGELITGCVTGGYAVGQNGAKIKNNFALIGGKTYLTDSTGRVIKSNAPVGFKGKTYILNSDGSIIKGKKIVFFRGKRYYVGPDGAVAKSSWVKLSAKSYYASGSGALYVNTVKPIKKKRYAFNKYGEKFRSTGFKTIGKKRYYLKKGVVVSGKKFTVRKKTYYAAANGALAKNKIITIKKKKYYFNKKGVMLKSVKKLKVGKKRYKINKSGVLRKI